MQKLSFKLQALLLLASMLLLSSCMVNHARIYEHAIEYDAVKVENPRTCYRHAGKRSAPPSRYGYVARFTGFECRSLALANCPINSNLSG